MTISFIHSRLRVPGRAVGERSLTIQRFACQVSIDGSDSQSNLLWERHLVPSNSVPKGPMGTKRLGTMHRDGIRLSTEIGLETRIGARLSHGS